MTCTDTDARLSIVGLLPFWFRLLDGLAGGALVQHLLEGLAAALGQQALEPLVLLLELLDAGLVGGEPVRHLARGLLEGLLALLLLDAEAGRRGRVAPPLVLLSLELGAFGGRQV